jgi:predicted Rossmann fold nucleotide-binding protein DprA/Smf involved in DNA uptake
VTRSDDVLEIFGLDRSLPPAVGIGPVAETLLGRLGGGPLTADDLLRATAVDPAAGAAALMELELAGRVTIEDGVYRAALS